MTGDLLSIYLEHSYVSCQLWLSYCCVIDYLPIYKILNYISASLTVLHLCYLANYLERCQAVYQPWQSDCCVDDCCCVRQSLHMLLPLVVVPQTSK